MSNVVEFAPRRTLAPKPEDTEWHARGTARCLGCKHEWQAVVPYIERNELLECPTCGDARGRLIGGLNPPGGSEVWECVCGTDLFIILRDGVWCLNCGTTSRFP